MYFLEWSDCFDFILCLASHHILSCRVNIQLNKGCIIYTTHKQLYSLTPINLSALHQQLSGINASVQWYIIPLCTVARIKLSTTLFIRSKQRVKVHRQVLGIHRKGGIVNSLILSTFYWFFFHYVISSWFISKRSYVLIVRINVLNNGRYTVNI